MYYISQLIHQYKIHHKLLKTVKKKSHKSYGTSLSDANFLLFFLNLL